MTRYFDASALVKLVVAERESGALDDHLASFPTKGATSLIGITETAIATARSGLLEESRNAVSSVNWLLVEGHAVYGLDVTPEITQSAAEFGASLRLRTLDAIHVATADAIRGSLMELVTYDKAMIAACRELGLPVVSPGAL